DIDDRVAIVLTVDHQAEAESVIDSFFRLVLRVEQLVRRCGIDELPAALRYAAKRWLRLERRKTVGEKAFPIVGQDAVERAENIVGRVRYNRWHRAAQRGATGAFAMERAAEVVERLRAARFLADECVGFQPDQLALIIKIDAAPPHRPVFA